MIYVPRGCCADAADPAKDRSHPAGRAPRARNRLSPAGRYPPAWAEMMFSEQRMQAQAGGNMLPRPTRAAFSAGTLPASAFPWRNRRRGPPPERGWATVRRAVALLPAETIKKLLAAPLNHALARLAFENSFTIREIPARRRSAGACAGGRRPVPGPVARSRRTAAGALGRTKLDYDGAPRRAYRKVRCD